MSLQTIIRDKGLKQAWVARKIDMDDSTFSTAIRGKSPFPRDKARPLAKALGVPLHVVLAAIGDIGGEATP